MDRNRPLLGGRCDRHSAGVVHLDEDAVELRALLLAAVDANGQMLAELVKLADLDRGAERARLQVEAQPFIAVMSVGLEIADDEQVDERKRDCVGVGYAQQPAVADADAAHRIQLRRQSKLTEGEQNPEHQADRDAERQIFGEKVGEHPPDHADRAAGIDHELKQPQHLVEQQQHCREDQRTDQRHRDRAGEITVNEADLPQFCPSRHHHLAAKAAEVPQRTDAPSRIEGVPFARVL